MRDSTTWKKADLLFYRRANLIFDDFLIKRKIITNLHNITTQTRYYILAKGKFSATKVKWWTLFIRRISLIIDLGRSSFPSFRHVPPKLFKWRLMMFLSTNAAIFYDKILYLSRVASSAKKMSSHRSENKSDKLTK